MCQLKTILSSKEVIQLFALSVFKVIFITLTALAGTMRDRSHGM